MNDAEKLVHLQELDRVSKGLAFDLAQLYLRASKAGSLEQREGYIDMADAVEGDIKLVMKLSCCVGIERSKRRAATLLNHKASAYLLDMFYAPKFMAWVNAK